MRLLVFDLVKINDLPRIFGSTKRSGHRKAWMLYGEQHPYLWAIRFHGLGSLRRKRTLPRAPPASPGFVCVTWP